MMEVYLSSDKEGFKLKEYVKKELLSQNYKIIDVSLSPHKDFVDSTNSLVYKLLENESAFGIAFDAYGAGSFITATKHKKIIAAEISEERSAYMTREHNNSRIITLGQEIIGNTLAKNIVLEFLKSNYEGGRHQIRVDMLNKML